MSEQLERFVVRLTKEELAGLEQLAKRQLRTVKDQIRHVLRKELFYAGLLPCGEEFQSDALPVEGGDPRDEVGKCL